MEIKILVDVTPKLEKALNDLCDAVTGCMLVKNDTATKLSEATQESGNCFYPGGCVPGPNNPENSIHEMPTFVAPVAPTPDIITPVAPVVPAVPVAAPKIYTLAEIQQACAPLMDAGKTDALIALTQSFGAQSLTDIPTEQYGTLVTKLRELGARL